MKPNSTDPVPFKLSRLREDPFLDAIARNPRPLIMVLIGIVGMIVIAIVSIASSSPSQGDSTDALTSAPEALQQVVREDPTALAASPTPPQAPLQTDPFTIDAEPSPLTDSATTVNSDPTVNSTADSTSESVPAAQKKSYITLIIDDIGNNSALGERAISLPGQVTFAVLPHTPFGVELAEKAHQAGKEIMLHAPMSNQSHMALGPGALTETLEKEEFNRVLEDSIESVPYLRGINNHMGSTLTELETQMTWVMEALKNHELYFVDSLTTAKSVAGKVAREYDIPTITRNVFLDNEATQENIDKEFKRLLKLAISKGSAVGIGHPYKETLEYLEKALPELAAQNIELIPASAMIQLQEHDALPTSPRAEVITEVVTEVGTEVKVQPEPTIEPPHT